MLKKLLGPGGVQRKRGGNVASKSARAVEGLVGKDIQKVVKALGGRAKRPGRARGGMSTAGSAAGGNVGQFALRELKKLGLAGLDSGVPGDIERAARKALGGKRHKKVGSRLEVWRGEAEKTSGGLRKGDLMVKKGTKGDRDSTIISKRQHARGKELARKYGFQ